MASGEHANTPAWKASHAWQKATRTPQVPPYGPTDWARVAVAADRVHLATQIEAMRSSAHDGFTMTEKFERELWLKGEMRMADAVLALLRDAP